jgi:hypothetical protein
MEIIENITLYKCGFCKKKMQRKHAMIKHEEHCSKNPKNWSACSGCVFMKEGETEVYYQNNYSGEMEESSKRCKTFHCEKFNKDLYPYKVVKKGLLGKYPESFEGMEQMPTTCEGWNYTK